MHRRPTRPLAAIPAAAASLVLCAAPAVARDRVVTLRGFDAPGPARFDRVKVLVQGSPRARHVLVLEPGTSAGAPYFRLVAADIVRRLTGWQVWSVDRRENVLEDHSVLDRALAGKATVGQVFEHYLGWIGSRPEPASHFRPLGSASAGFVKSWGMNVAMEDLRRVVRAARRGGRTVVLGGHSLGGAMTAAYAT
jgi:pimeloyl-ACP methyl ester carboxylesterase